eukprot:1368050-Rhodomonas_salina.1
MLRASAPTVHSSRDNPPLRTPATSTDARSSLQPAPGVRAARLFASGVIATRSAPFSDAETAWSALRLSSLDA